MPSCWIQTVQSPVIRRVLTPMVHFELDGRRLWLRQSSSTYPTATETPTSDHDIWKPFAVAGTTENSRHWIEIDVRWLVRRTCRNTPWWSLANDDDGVNLMGLGRFAILLFFLGLSYWALKAYGPYWNWPLDLGLYEIRISKILTEPAPIVIFHQSVKLPRSCPKP